MEGQRANQSTLKSKVKASYFLVNGSLYAFFVSLIVFVGFLDSVSIGYRIAVWIVASLLVSFIIYHFYSIPKVLINDESIRIYVRGKVIRSFSKERIRKVDLLVKEEILWRGLLGHAIQIEGEQSFLLANHYYSNLDELLLSLSSNSEQGKRPRLKYEFAPSSLLSNFRVFRSFTAATILGVFGLFVWMVFLIMQRSSPDQLNWGLLAILVIVLLFFGLGLSKVIGHVSIEGDRLVGHYPFFMMRKTIPKSEIRKGRLQVFQSRGEVRSLVIITKSYHQYLFNAQLNSKSEIEYVKKCLKV